MLHRNTVTSRTINRTDQTRLARRVDKQFILFGIYLAFDLRLPVHLKVLGAMFQLSCLKTNMICLIECTNGDNQVMGTWECVECQLFAFQLL